MAIKQDAGASQYTFPTKTLGTRKKSKSDYKIYVEIEDGRKGLFDMKPYLKRGVFQELKDINYFNQVGVLFNAVTWPHGQDIAPETLIEDMQVVQTEPDS